jgi:hypothetical protein
MHIQAKGAAIDLRNAVFYQLNQLWVEPRSFNVHVGFEHAVPKTFGGILERNSLCHILFFLFVVIGSTGVKQKRRMKRDRVGENLLKMLQNPLNELVPAPAFFNRNWFL